MSVVLRPGWFLGNHYVSFNVLHRSFVVALDRLKESMRVSRRNKVKRRKEEKKKNNN